MIVIMVLEIIFVVTLIYGVLTQVLLPIYRGTVLFPFFRKRAVLEQEIRQAKEELDEKYLKEEADKIRNKSKK